MNISLNDYAAAVFDLDGTLLNTLQDIAEAANRTLAQQEYPTHPVEAFCYLVGDGPDVLFQRALKAASPDDPRIAPLVEAYKQECLNQDDQHTKLYDGLTTMLDQFQAADLSLTILTNKRQPHADRCVARFLQQWNWRIVLGSGDHIPKKPDPTRALDITKSLEITPEQCIYFGDTDVDMWTAKRAGMTAVGVLWGFRDEKELRSAGADFIIQHPSELVF